MTDLLKKAFDAAPRLPDDEQDAVAEWLLAELASEEKWDEHFAKSQTALSLLAHEALDEYERDETQGSGSRFALKVGRIVATHQVSCA